MSTLHPDIEIFRCDQCGLLLCGCEDMELEIIPYIDLNSDPWLCIHCGKYGINCECILFPDGTGGLW